MTKHTPGPWRVGKHNPDTVHADFTLCELSGIYPEKAANAHLIAAAPDLLAALRAAAANLAALSDTVAAYPRPSNDPDGHLLLAAREQSKAAAFAARAAIARAEGNT